jgi:class 3 adenylate cyclase
MAALGLALAAQADVTGFPPAAMVMVQMAIMVVFASVGFAGTFRLFLLWAAAVLGLFALWLAMQPVSAISTLYTLTNFSTFLLFALYFNWDLERRARKVFAANLALEAERAKTEELLYNVLPREVAARLRAGEAVADSFSDVTVVFVDLVGFSRIAKRLSPGHLVVTLNSFFSAADRCAERHGLEKVKTIGDAYLAVAGGTGSRGTDSRAAVAFARELIGQLAAIAAETGRAVPHVIKPRRAGDPTYLVADASAARKVLGFVPAHSDLATIIRDAWAWHKKAHPLKAGEPAARAPKAV